MLHAGLDLCRRKVDVCLLSEDGEHLDQLAVAPDSDSNGRSERSVSVEQVARSDGTKVWRVRWRDEHGRNRSKSLGRKRDAEAFDAEIRRMRRLGELGLMDAGRVTLGRAAHGACV